MAYQRNDPQEQSNITDYEVRAGHANQNYKNAGRAVPRQTNGYDTKLVQDTEPLHVSESGATSSHIPLRYDLIPRSLIEVAAQRYTLGAIKHGERGYQKGLGDRDFIINRINHIYEHLNKLIHPDYRNADGPGDEEGIEVNSINDNLGAIIWGIGFLCEVASHKPGLGILQNLRIVSRVMTHTE